MNNSKKGISLSILVISMVVLFALVTVTVTNIDSPLEKAKEYANKNDLIEIRNAVLNKMINAPNENNIIQSFVSNNNNKGYKFNELEKTVEANKLDSFRKNVQLKAEYLFYQIDIGKIGLTNLKTGNKQSGPTDIYFAEYNNKFKKFKKVIYLKGYKNEYSDEYTFTLSDQEFPELDIRALRNGSVQNVNNFSIKPLTNIVKKNHKWTNSIAFVIENPEVKNVIIHNIDETKHIEKEITNGELVIDKSVMSNFGYNENNLILEFNGEKQVVDISNLDCEIETKELTYLKEADGYKVVPGIKDTRSKLKCYKYIALKEGEAIEQTSEYVNTFGKEAIDFIKVPLDTKNIAVIAIDNAGNISNVMMKDLK